MGTWPKVSRTWVAVVVSLAYGLLISSTAISRVDGSGFDSQAITLARVASLFEVFLFAWFFRHRMPSPKRLFAYGLACEIAYLQGSSQGSFAVCQKGRSCSCCAFYFPSKHPGTVRFL